MKMVGITPCYRITLENGSYGVETYIDADSKIQITFEDGNTLIGYIECVEYGTYSEENDTLVIRVENGELYILSGNRIKDIEELHEESKRTGHRQPTKDCPRPVLCRCVFGICYAIERHF